MPLLKLTQFGGIAPRQRPNNLHQAMAQVAEELGIAIRWGGDWNQNGRSDDEKFYDGPHFELLRSVYP